MCSSLGGGSLPVPFPRAEVRWGSPGSPGAAPRARWQHEVAVSPWYLAKERETGRSELLGCAAWPCTAPPAESSPVFSPLAGCDKQVHFLPPLFPVSPSATHEENPAWSIPLAAQNVNCHCGRPFFCHKSTRQMERIHSGLQVQGFPKKH